MSLHYVSAFELRNFRTSNVLQKLRFLGKFFNCLGRPASAKVASLQWLPQWLYARAGDQARSTSGSSARSAFRHRFPSSSAELFPETRHQRCWCHKVCNIMDKMPKAKRAQAKSDLQNIWMAETKEDAENAMALFVSKYQDKYPKAVER